MVRPSSLSHPPLQGWPAGVEEISCKRRQELVVESREARARARVMIGKYMVRTFGRKVVTDVIL